MTRPPFPLVLSAPSGAGKSTLARRLMERRADLAFSVSATTRAPRPGEVDGVHYHFVDRPAFERMIEEGALIEWAAVHGNLYGTPVSEVERARGAGRHLLLDIDVQGAEQVRARVPDAVLVFVLPPSGEVLAERLAGRGTDAADVRRRRLAAALGEVRRAPAFDYVIVNDELDRAADDLEAILDAEAHRARRVDALDALVARVSEEIERLTGDAPVPNP